MLCCDKCPRVFHFRCTKLDQEPEGEEWYCSVCTVGALCMYVCRWCVCLHDAHTCVCMWCMVCQEVCVPLQGLARSKRIKKTKPDDLQECLQKAVCRLMFPGVS